jgi:hypothetical protein
LAEKYHDISTYAYTLNNPIIYNDPTGNYIVGTDGAPVTRDPSSKTGYSANISKSALQLANAMNSTEQGRSDFNDMFDSTDQAYQLKINNSKRGSFGGIKYGTTDNGDDLNVITVYAGEIAAAVDHVKNGGLLGLKEFDPNPKGPTSHEQADLMNTIAEKMSFTDAVLSIGASVVSHEKGHVENNSRNIIDNSGQKEVLPEEKETKVLKQTVEQIED